MTTQPEARRLADVLDAYHKRAEDKEAAALLRAQHEALDRKDALLRQCLEAFETDEFMKKLNAASEIRKDLQ